MARTLITAGDLPTRKGISLSERQRKRLEEKRLFPKRVQISERTHGYVEQEIDAYVESCINARDDAA